MDDFEPVEEINDFEYTATNQQFTLNNQYLFSIRKVYDNKAIVQLVIKPNGSTSSYSLTEGSYYKIGTFDFSNTPSGFGTIEDDGSQPDFLSDIRQGTSWSDTIYTSGFYMDLNILDPEKFPLFFV